MTDAPSRRSLLKWSLICVPALLLLGRLSGWLSGGSGDDPWFEALAKPDLYPPPATFGIEWGILYVMMGLALALLLAARISPERRKALIAFAVQLLLNLAWSPLFFGAHQIGPALALLLAIDVAVILTITLSWRVNRAAALLLVPYCGWVLFATVLNWQFLSLNPGA